MAWRPLPRRGGPPPQRIDTSLARVLRHLGVPDVGSLPALEDTWSEVVGPALAAHSTPVTLQHGRLVVRVDDPAWASQLRWMERQVVAKLREAPGYDHVEALEVRVGPGSR